MTPPMAANLTSSLRFEDCEQASQLKSKMLQANFHGSDNTRAEQFERSVSFVRLGMCQHCMTVN